MSEKVLALSDSEKKVIEKAIPTTDETTLRLASDGNWLSKYPNIATGSDYLQNTDGVSGTGATVSSSTDWAYEGSKSFKVVTNNSASGEGVIILTENMLPTTPGQERYISTYLKGSSGTVKAQLVFKKSDGSDAGTITGADITLSTTPQMISVSGVAPADTTYMILKIITTTQQGITFYVDKVHINDSSSSKIRLPVLIEEKTVSEATEITFSNLDGDKDIEYYLEFYCYYTCTGYGLTYLLPNNVTTDLSGHYHRFWAGSTSGSTYTDKIPLSYAGANGNTVYLYGFVNMYVKKDSEKMFIGETTARAPDYHFVHMINGSWINTTDNLTNLKIKSDVAKFTGIFKLYKKVDINLQNLL